MSKIARDSLMTLEAYSKARPEFRTRIMAHKKNRTVRLGWHLTLQFEDELTADKALFPYEKQAQTWFQHNKLRHSSYLPSFHKQYVQEPLWFA